MPSAVPLCLPRAAGLEGSGPQHLPQKTQLCYFHHNESVCPQVVGSEQSHLRGGPETCLCLGHRVVPWFGTHPLESGPLGSLLLP